ncbi:MAG TPA: thioredoxin [Leptolyngbyaceae cyanobacterium M33_DOE_097]|uniref:Thioredoxin n=1 Tax=Oscillatoriales cyanobacterium SpSt-418 TaxID=2282169 RepID=A0A7C3KFU6_9CYAN|nr:thioredoxin [Leptolyngbyaceae cyanobacterium M33_DOE_097]
MSSVSAVSNATFETEVLASDVPVLVDFWAPWCGPCRIVGPVVDQIATEFSDKVKVVKLNVDENADIANTYGIRSIPTLVVFKGGQQIDKVIGAVPKATIASTLEKHLAS